MEPVLLVGGALVGQEKSREGKKAGDLILYRRSPRTIEKISWKAFDAGPPRPLQCTVSFVVARRGMKWTWDVRYMTRDGFVTGSALEASIPIYMFS